ISMFGSQKSRGKRLWKPPAKAGQWQARHFDFNSNFTLTAGFACPTGRMGEPFPYWRSFEADTGF
ncbi:hypothetical protein, partial [Mesorhizobium sp. M7A.F.Ca.US.006.04.2.1]|uniref:hypothetical protein n=1 Tax=Mesorhizobium sp. M7A.F.Ca.US.006.04.2.1 TaxID=2496696 RepID=UPI0019D438ED